MLDHGSFITHGTVNLASNILSGDLTKAILPSLGGLFIVTLLSISF